MVRRDPTHWEHGSHSLGLGNKTAPTVWDVLVRLFFLPDNGWPQFKVEFALLGAAILITGYITRRNIRIRDERLNALQTFVDDLNEIVVDLEAQHGIRNGTQEGIYHEDVSSRLRSRR